MATCEPNEKFLNSSQRLSVASYCLTMTVTTKLCIGCSSLSTTTLSFRKGWGKEEKIDSFQFVLEKYFLMENNALVNNS